MKIAALLAAGAVALTATGITLAAQAASAPIAGTAAPVAREVEPFHLSGALTLNGRWTMSYGACVGAGGYNDIRHGTNVTVWDATGKIIGSGELGPGIVSSSSCLFPWLVESIPPGVGPYQYEISHRGRMTLTEEEARDVALAELGR